MGAGAQRGTASCLRSHSQIIKTNQAHAHPWLLSGASTPQRVQLWAQGAEGWPVLRAGRPAQLHEFLNLMVGSKVGGA